MKLGNILNKKQKDNGEDDNSTVDGDSDNQKEDGLDDEEKHDKVSAIGSEPH